MKVERAFAGFGFPFIFGVTSAVLTEPLLCNSPLKYLTVAGAVLPLVILLHPHRVSTLVQWLAVGVSALCCGMFTGIAGAELEISILPEGGWLSRTALHFGSRMEAAIDRVPFSDPQTNALIKALLTGERTGMEKDTIQAFRDSGAAHILALSGLHLGMIYGIVSRLLSIIGNSPGAKSARSAAIILLCGFYTLATGAGASITRAFLFILLGEAAGVSGRLRDTGTILLAAATIQLTLSPAAIKDIGFQLSYSAMAGIAFILPWLDGFWKPSGNSRGLMKLAEGGLRWMWKSAAMSIACQITTGPLAHHYFGTFPHNFLLTNLIAIPLTGLIIPASLLTTGLSLIGVNIPILLDINEILTEALTYSLSVIASM